MRDLAKILMSVLRSEIGVQLAVHSRSFPGFEIVTTMACNSSAGKEPESAAALKTEAK